MSGGGMLNDNFFERIAQMQRGQQTPFNIQTPMSLDPNLALRTNTPPSGYRPTADSPQFYQPIYQPQQMNYSMTNPMAVSMYGQDFGSMQNPFLYDGLGNYMQNMQAQEQQYMQSPNYMGNYETDSGQWAKPISLSGAPRDATFDTNGSQGSGAGNTTTFEGAAQGGLMSLMGKK